MSAYRVEIFYRTKRGGVCLGMTVDALGPDEAEEYARKVALKGYPARQWMATNIREATPSDIALGVSKA